MTPLARALFRLEGPAFVAAFVAGCFAAALLDYYRTPTPDLTKVDPPAIARDAGDRTVSWESRMTTRAPDICADVPGTLHTLNDPNPVTLGRLLAAVYPHQRFVYGPSQPQHLPVHARLVDVSRSRLAQAVLDSNDLAFACSMAGTSDRPSRLAPPPATTDPFNRRAVLITTKDDMREHASDYARSWALPRDVTIPTIAKRLTELGRLLEADKRPARRRRK